MTRFGKFILVQQIGGGRLSQVYSVARRGGRGPLGVALKRVCPTLLAEPAFVQLVAREAGVLSRLDHPNLCRCYEMGVIDGCAFLTLEMVQGCTLRALMRRTSAERSPLPTAAILTIAYQLAQVLDYLHRQCSHPLVHLDLSPQNVLISAEGEIKLIDFGIARYLDGDNPPPLGGRLAGTIGYMSPEQASGAEQLGPEADQYCLGILLWEMRATRRLFRGNTRETWRRMRVGDAPRLQSSEHIGTDGGTFSLNSIIARLLAARPSDRWPHMGQAAKSLATHAVDLERGRVMVARLVTALLDDPSFDRYDAAGLRAPPIDEPGEIPSGVVVADPYAALEIAVEQGEGSAAAQMRAVVPSQSAALPTSPFLETVADGGARNGEFG